MLYIFDLQDMRSFVQCCTAQQDVLTAQDGYAWAGSNLDELLAPFSISVEPSTVLQAVCGDASLHPTHACIGVDGILSKSLAAALTAPTQPFDQLQIRNLLSVGGPLLLPSVLAVE